MVGLTTVATTQYVKCSTSRTLTAEITTLGISFLGFFSLFSQILFGLDAKLYLTLGTVWAVACQAPLSMGFSRQEYWSGLPFPFPLVSVLIHRFDEAKESVAPDSIGMPGVDAWSSDVLKLYFSWYRWTGRNTILPSPCAQNGEGGKASITSCPE